MPDIMITTDLQERIDRAAQRFADSAREAGEAMVRAWEPVFGAARVALADFCVALEPVHREIFRAWLVQRGIPASIAAVLARRLPRVWLPAIDKLYAGIEPDTDLL